MKSRRGNGLRAQIAERPWLLVVGGMLFFLGLTTSFLIVAIQNPPILIE